MAVDQAIAHARNASHRGNTPRELLAVLRASERAGHRETARRLRSFASRVFRYAVATARASTDPAQPLLGALIAPVAVHHAAIINPVEFGGLLRAMGGYSDQPVTRLAMLFPAHVFQRPGEIRKAEWTEINFDKAVWSIPAARMKQRLPHRVPLSRQAIAILKDARAPSGDGRFVFPKLGSPLKPMCENNVNQALRRLGYGHEQMTAHGFRSTASTCSMSAAGGVRMRLNARCPTPTATSFAPPIIAEVTGMSGSK